MNRRRVVAGLAGLALLIGLGAAPPVQQTDAAWADPEFGSGSFAALTLVTPVVTGCSVTSFLGTFTGFTITWTSTHDKGFQRLTIQDVAVPPANISQTGTGLWTYSSTLSASVLSTLLTGGLLGATNTVKVFTAAGLNWRSPATVTRTLSVGGLLGLGGNNTCT